MYALLGYEHADLTVQLGYLSYESLLPSSTPPPPTLHIMFII